MLFKKAEYKTIFFGSYPQTIKDESIRILNKDSNTGYYLGTDGEKYELLKANPFDKGVKFSNGEEIIKGKEYYFKVEPITFMVLSETEDDMFLFTKDLLDVSKYDDKSNNYEKSYIRSYLNNDFLYKAFIEKERDLIKITKVKNDSESTGVDNNPNISPDTNDKIFLLSYEEVLQTKYKFTDTDRFCLERQKVGTDFAKAKGMYLYEENGWYYLRSPIESDNISVNYVFFDGSIGLLDTNFNDGCFAFGIHIKK